MKKNFQLPGDMRQVLQKIWSSTQEDDTTSKKGTEKNATSLRKLRSLSFLFTFNYVIHHAAV